MQQHAITRQALRGGRALITAIAVVILAFALVVTLPRLFGYQTYAITSGSMAGSIEPGSLVFSRSVPTAEVGVGDVITYVPPVQTGVTSHVTHRVVSKQRGDDGTVYETKGDANEGVDPWTFQLDGDRQAVVEFTVPVLGRLVLLLEDPMKRQLAIGLPALGIAIGAAAELVRELRSRGAVAPVPTASPVVPPVEPAAATPARAMAGASFAARRDSTR